ncbi:hypothetical protein BaRGS_00001595 [Batillaria attramentaria]|uniref:Uncharacterized protein n=1 Tax=Batillaria attramentaria TaxID=370345 RepID=A0ABD0M803_9CAEN
MFRCIKRREFHGTGRRFTVGLPIPINSNDFQIDQGVCDLENIHWDFWNSARGRRDGGDGLADLTLFCRPALSTRVLGLQPQGP